MSAWHSRPSILNIALTNIPDLGDTTSHTSAFYASASHRHREVIGAYLGVASASAFLLFISTLSKRVLPVAAAAAFAAAAIVAQATFLAPTASVSLGFSGAKFVDATFAREASTLADAVLFGAWALAGLAVVAVARDLRHRWLFWLSAVIGVVTLLLTFTFFPVILLALWAVVVAIAMLVRRDVAATGDGVTK